MNTFLWMLVAHALCDYPLQGDFLARAKNRNQPIPGVPWQQALAAHALIQAGAVAFVTGNVWLGALEFVAHLLIDWAKCDGRLSFNTDQALHVACKIAWALMLVAV